MSTERVNVSVKRDHIHLMNKLFKWEPSLNKFVAQPNVFFNIPNLEADMGDFVGALNYFENQQYPAPAPAPDPSTNTPIVVKDFRTNDDLLFDLNWGEYKRFATGGGAGRNDINISCQFSYNSLSFKLTIPSGITRAYPQLGRFSFYEYQGIPFVRSMTVSKHIADFRDVDPSGNNGPLKVSVGLIPVIMFNTGLTNNDDCISLMPGQTYYINIKNIDTSNNIFKFFTKDNNVGQLNGAFEAGWPIIPGKGPIVPN